MVYFGLMLKRFNTLLLLAFTAGLAWGQTYPLGATPYAGSMGTGTSFRVWAGSATSVVVVGTFNNWSTSANPLVREGATQIWSANVSGARPGHQFHYLINGQHRRRDPRSTRIVKHDVADSIIYDQNAYAWKSGNFVPPSLEEMVIYEMHIGTFNDPHPETGGSASLDDARQKLDYVASLGANAVKIMPVTEFPGLHSWGYNPTDLYAVDNLIYGGPDALKRFVDDAHQRGIAVILDIVHNHYSDAAASDNMQYSLWNFDGNPGPLGGGMYFYQDAAKAQTQWGPRPDYSNEQVRAFIKDNVRMWLSDYRIDGFRWDATKFIRKQADEITTIAEGESLLREVNAIIRNEFTNKFSIAEDLAQLPSTTAPTNTGGLGFHSDWHTEVHFALVQEIAKTNATPDYWRITREAALNYTSHTRRVVYTESHDEVGQKNGKSRVPYRMDPANPTSQLARRKSMLAAGLMFGTPGIPMIFQGQEMLETIAFEDTNSVRWALAGQNSGVQNFYKDMMHLRRNYFGNTGGLTGRFDFARTETLVNSTNQVLTMHRLNQGGAGDDTFIVANLSGVSHPDDWITFPAAGNWYAVLNSDSTKYGTDFTNTGISPAFAYADGRGQISLAPWSFIVYARAPMPTNYGGMAVTGPFRGWVNSTNMTLSQDHVWSVDLDLTATNQFEFKFVANANWDLAWGMGSIQTNAWPVTGTGNPAPGAADYSLAIPADGTYRFEFNSASQKFNIYRIQPLTMGSRHPSMTLVMITNVVNDLSPNMQLNSNGLWEASFSIMQNHDRKFKFAAYGTYAVSWGDQDRVLTSFPASGTAISGASSNLVLPGPLNGTYTFTFNDRTAEYTVNRTGSAEPYAGMAIVANFSGQNPWPFHAMTSNGLHQWIFITNLAMSGNAEFKFAANGSWDISWGSNILHESQMPVSGRVTLGGDNNNVRIRGPLNGVYRFEFNSDTLEYSVRRHAGVTPFDVAPVSRQGNKVVLNWPAHTNAVYFIQRSTNLTLPNGGFTNYAINIPAATAMNVYTITVDNAVAEYYRFGGW